jgi:acyl-CoA synthetase (AMP-forming)/AMP-acid ligase II
VNLNLLAHPSAKKLDHPVRVTVAASAPSATLFKRMALYNLLPVHVYGLTEVYGPSTKNYYLPSFHDLHEEERWHKMAKWQGHGFLGTREVRVLKRTTDSEQGWVEVARDGKDVGEVVFRGNIVMKGYLNNHEGTKKAFEGGWFWSGDLAVIHPGGQIEIVDREKDIIISGIPSLMFVLSIGGENISSLSVEATLLGNPLVHEVAVIPIPHEKWGERPKAIIILPPGTPYRKGIEEEIRQWAKGKLAGWMVPDVVEIVDELPKTATGKVKKHILKAKK